MITALFALAGLALLVLTWSRREEQVFAVLLAAGWAVTFTEHLMTPTAWGFTALLVDGLLVMAGAVSLAVRPRLWVGVLVGAGLLQLCAHLLVGASSGSQLDLWRYLSSLDVLFAVQLVALASPGLMRRFGRRRTLHDDPGGPSALGSRA